MNRKMYWGLGVLVLLICTAFVFMTVRNRAEIREMENESAAAKAFEKQQTDGHSHGDRSHEKSVAQADALTPTVQPVQVKQPVTTYKDNGEYIKIDYSVFDKPEELIARIGEIMLNREKYSTAEYDRAAQESSVLGSKINAGYYGEGEYRDKLRELKNKTYGDALLKRGFGISREELRAMIRGEIPPLVVPIDPAVVRVDANKEGSK